MNYVSSFLALILLLSLVSCASTEPAPRQPEYRSRPQAAPGTVDMVGLQRHLAIPLAAHQEGYADKEFNTCEVGYGYSKTHDCRPMHFVLIQFRLLCRDSEGTVSTTDHRLTPIARQRVEFRLGSFKGWAQTNSSGFGVIRHASRHSPRGDWLRIYVNGKFLAVRAKEIREIVVPQDWCS